MKTRDAKQACKALLAWFVSQDLSETESVEVMTFTIAHLIFKIAKRDDLKPHGGVDRVHQLMMELINREAKKG